MGLSLKVKVHVSPTPLSKLPLVVGELKSTHKNFSSQDSSGKSNPESQVGAGSQQLTCTG